MAKFISGTQPTTGQSNDALIIEQATNYAFTLQKKKVSFATIRETSSVFYRMLPDEIQTQLFEDISRGVCPLDSEPCLNTYMFALGKMHNAKLRRAYDHLSAEFRQNNLVDIVDYGCGQGMGCICYADFLRENGLRQRVRRVILIEPSRLALARAALHVSLLFPDAELKTVCKGFDDLTVNDLPSDPEVATLHILSNVLDLGDRFFRLNDFSDLVAQSLKGRNEFVCVEPLFNGYNKDDKPYDFFERVNIKIYFDVQYGKNEFVPGEQWTCVILLGTASDGNVKYDFTGESHEGLEQVRLYDKYGFIDRIGKEIILLMKYDIAGSSSEGFARVALNGKYGFIDCTGKEIIPLKYDDASDFFQGLARVKLNGRHGFIDCTGKEIIPLKYDYAWDFCEGLGLAKASLNGKYGFIDCTGKEIIPLKYDDASDFFQGLARVKLNGRHGFIDCTGKEIIPLKYDYAWDFCEGLASVTLNRKWSYIDRTGKEIIPLKYDCAIPFSEGLAMVALNGRHGFIDCTGKEIIPLKYDDAESFREGLAMVALNGRYGFINRTGKEIIPLKYDCAKSFREGLAMVALNGKWGFINRTGKEIIPLKYDDAWDFIKGLAKVKLNGKWSYIDRTGKEISR